MFRNRSLVPMVSVALAAGALAAVSVPAIAQDAVAGRNLAQTCTNCHGTGGFAIGGMPSLAGVDRGHLVRQMRDFRDGKRAATIMHQIARGFTDGEIELIAGFFAAQKGAGSK